MKIEKTCPKCGYDDVVMDFMKVGKKIYQQDKEYKLLKNFLKEESVETPYTNAVYRVKRECVKVHCRTCQYAWVSETADAEEKHGAFQLTDEEIEKLKIDLNDNIPKPGFIDPFNYDCTYSKGGVVNERTTNDIFGEMFGEMFPNGSFNGWDR